jgi:hypothetical protein
VVQLRRQDQLTRRIQDKLAAAAGKKTEGTAAPAPMPGTPEVPPTLADAEPATLIVQ